MSYFYRRENWDVIMFTSSLYYKCVCMPKNSKKGALIEFGSVLPVRSAHLSKPQKEKVRSIREWLKNHIT